MAVAGILLVGGAGYLIYRHSHSKATPAATSTPVAALTPALMITSTPVPVGSTTPALSWTGQLDCRGKTVPVSNYSGVCYVSSLDLAKVLTPAEIERVHRKEAALYLDQQVVGQVVTVHQEELVPIDPLMPSLGLKIQVDEAAHSVKATANPGATASPRP